MNEKDLIKQYYICATICLLSLMGCQSGNNILYVAINGNDQNTGSKANPLRSLETALIKAQVQKIKHIQLRAGTHYLKETITLDQRFSGTDKIPFRISNFPGEEAIISGGKLLNVNWKPYKNGIMRAKIDPKIDFDQVFVNGKKQIRARYPNHDPKVNIYNGYSADALSPERISSWKNPVGGFVHAMHVAHWGGYHYQISGVNEAGELELVGGYQNNRQMGMHKEYRYVENIFEELDVPGEWYLDKHSSHLYIYPEKGISLQNAKIEVSILKHLFEIKGSETNPTQYIRMEGLGLTHTRYTFMEVKEPLLRSDWAIYRGAAILLEGAEHCHIRDNYFFNLGGNAVFVNKYNRDISINSNHFENIGASAVCFVGDPLAVRSPSFEYHEFVPFEKLDRVPGPKSNNYPSQCSVHNNLIHDIGRIEKQTAGIQISMASELTLSHNSIYNTPRAGINISEGTWGGHIIEFNDVFNTVLETGDHGAFNSWGRDRFWHPNRTEMNRMAEKEPALIKLDANKTTIIRNNRFRCDHGWDIDLDDGSSNYHIYNNVCLNGGLKLREGFYRKVENNIMINNSFHPHVWFKKSGDIFRRNIVLNKYRPIRLDDWGEEIDYNFFPDSLSLVYAQAQKEGQDIHSIYGNPGFIAPEEGNYQVNKASMALDIGFENFPMDQFGVLTDNLKKLAQTPEIPQLIRQEFQVKKQKTFELLGMTLKNIESVEEQSASGLVNTQGVIILDLIHNSLAQKSGLRKGDVIVKSGDNKVIDIPSLYEAYQGDRWKGRLSLQIMRDQQNQDIELILR